MALGGPELSRLTFRGIAASATPDGQWTTSANPLESAVSGFRLTASLATDPGVHADTVIVPTYGCTRAAIGLPLSDRYNEVKARVRIGVFPSPFYDSIVVASVEPEGGFATVFIVDPSRMKPRTVTVSANGKPGAAGRAGSAGNDGGPCENGGDGTDGDPGENGEFGGRVDIVVDAAAPWLESMVGVSNTGGRGGNGGQAGRGGRPGQRTSTTGCNPVSGHPGKAGRAGQDGAPGSFPTTTREERSLLWRGSPVWFDSTGRASLEQLLELSSRRR